MKYFFTVFVFIISLSLNAQYKEFVPGPYRIGDTVQVSSKNSLFKAVKSFTAYSIPSDNQYWDFAGAISEARIKELDARLKVAEAEIVKQKATNLLFSETIAAIEDKLETTPTPTDPAPGSKYLSLPMSAPIDLSGQSNIVIENKRFENAPANSIRLMNCTNITIRNCFINKAGAEAIAMEGCTNVKVENCLVVGVLTGVYANRSTAVKVLNNQFVNVRQRIITNADGTVSKSRGQFVQFNGVYGGGNEVIGNVGENFPGESNAEDMFSMFSSSGTAASPILVKNNVGRGGGPSQSGGGIVAGDHNGSYVVIDGNTLMNPGQYGIAIAGGNYNTITNNKIFSKQFPWSNNPLFIWAQVGSTSCTNNVIKSNRATWTNRDGIINGGWNAGNCTNTVWEYPTAITEAELNMPAHLIDFVTPDELQKIRSK